MTTSLIVSWPRIPYSHPHHSGRRYLLSLVPDLLHSKYGSSKSFLLVSYQTFMSPLGPTVLGVIVGPVTAFSYPSFVGYESLRRPFVSGSPVPMTCLSSPSQLPHSLKRLLCKVPRGSHSKSLTLLQSQLPAFSWSMFAFREQFLIILQVLPLKSCNFVWNQTHVPRLNFDV